MEFPSGDLKERSFSIKIFLQSINKKKIGFYFIFFLCFVITTTSQIKPRDYFCLWGWQNITLCAGIHFIIIIFYSSMEYINEMSYTFNLLFSRLFFFHFLCFIFLTLLDQGVKKGNNLCKEKSTEIWSDKFLIFLFLKNFYIFYWNREMFLFDLYTHSLVLYSEQTSREQGAMGLIHFVQNPKFV